MPRPSVAAERREQIIQAAIQTLAEHGAKNASLDRIADAAGMSRGHIRHFVGNRDRLLRDAARTVFFNPDGSPSILPDGTDSFAAAVDFLFSPEFTAYDPENRVVLALVDISHANQEIAGIIADSYTQTRAQLAGFLASDFPGTAPGVRKTVADGTLTIALGNVFLGEFDTDPERSASARTAADLLARSLR